MDHLWEEDHPYYCCEGNYFAAGHHTKYDSLDDFLDEFADADIDMNLVWRWDWREGEDWGCPPGEGRLLIYIMHQRKAKCGSHEISVTHDDEPRVREFLKPHWEQMQEIWRPLAETNPSKGEGI